jgi:beta-glucosidase
MSQRSLLWINNHSEDELSFPKDFVWGAAAASYQIEGSECIDGKGLNVWDVFCQRPGTVYNCHSGDIACDHYHRYKEDVALMKQIRLHAYRFSISWARVLPEGVGRVNEKGLEFYDKLVDELLASGIEPYVTIFHWDYPHELYLKGGWLNRESADWFAEYTKVVVDRLSDRVSNWMTLNEPQCFIVLGHHDGTHAPGIRLEVKNVLQAVHNTLLAHGKSVQTIRANAKKTPKVGMASVAVVKFPETDSPADIEAARNATFSVANGGGLWANTLWLDPIYLGRYPEDAYEFFSDKMPEVRDGDMETISQPLDYFALNIYNGEKVKAGPDGKAVGSPVPPGAPQTAFRWPVTPECMYWGPKFYSQRYGNLPFYITENGLSNQDWIALDGGVHDPQRIDFLNRYLLQYEKAGQDGVDIRGYFQWSILDNFEWAEGFKERFGLIYVDYPTQKRVLKDSAYWYSEVIRTNGENL